MSELSSTEISPPVVEFAPPDIARRHIATWNGLQTDAVEVVRREPFAYEYRAAHHLLIMCERAERDDGETVVEGLPRSTLHEYSHKLSFVPAGHRFSGWQKPRAVTRVTYFYIDPQGPLIDPALHFAETEFKPRLFLLRQRLVGNGSKAEGAGQEPGRPAPICRGPQRRDGARTAAPQQHRSSRKAVFSRRSCRLAGEEGGAVYRRAPA